MGALKNKSIILSSIVAGILSSSIARADASIELANLKSFEYPFIATTLYRPQIGPEVQLVLVIYTGTKAQYETDGSMYYTEFDYIVPNLKYNQKKHEVVYDDPSGEKIVCATEVTSKVFGFSWTSLVSTDACTPVIETKDGSNASVLNYKVLTP